MSRNLDLLEIKNAVFELRNQMKLFIPQQISISEVSRITGVQRNTILQYVHRNYEPDVEYYMVGNKTTVTQKVYQELIMRYCDVA